jgi:hypothetical protein
MIQPETMCENPELENVMVAVDAASDRSGIVGDAGWSSPVARQAHNLKVVGSNPAPATTFVIVY